MLQDCKSHFMDKIFWSHCTCGCKQSRNHTKNTTPTSLQWELTITINADCYCFQYVMHTVYSVAKKKEILTTVYTQFHGLSFSTRMPVCYPDAVSLPATPSHLSGLNYVFPSTRHMSCITNCLALCCSFVYHPHRESAINIMWQLIFKYQKKMFASRFQNKS